MWFDGVSNLLGNGIGVVLASPRGQCFPFSARLGFDCTNNMAEYEAYTMGIMMALEHQVKKLKVFGDSALIIYQLHGEWETRNAKLVPYHDLIKEMIESFDVVTFHHVSREENQMADSRRSRNLISHGTNKRGARNDYSLHCEYLSNEYFDIKKYLANGEYPEGASKNSKRTLRRLSSIFFLSGTILYKRSSDMILLRCVDRTFDTHANEHALARKILRVGYYWTNMESDCYQHVRRCVKCQTYVDHINVAPFTLHSLTSPWTFSMWGIDMIGPIEPNASNGHRFILVAIDYFTKSVEAAFYPNVTRSIVVRFIKRDIICRYSLLAYIITDNGTNLNNKMMNELCK
ncbi:Retrovirus-related Pol polyprotein, partial [Mucuna pruriens]